MMLEVRNHDVRSLNELPGLPYITHKYCIYKHITCLQFLTDNTELNDPRIIIWLLFKEFRFVMSLKK